MIRRITVTRIAPNLWVLHREAFTLGYYNNFRQAVKARQLITHIMAAADKKLKEIMKEDAL